MMVAQYDQGSAEQERITAAMSRPSLFDSFVRHLAGQGCRRAIAIPAYATWRPAERAL